MTFILYMTEWPAPAECHVATEPSNKAQQGTNIARNTVHTRLFLKR